MEKKKAVFYTMEDQLVQENIKYSVIFSDPPVQRFHGAAFIKILGNYNSWAKLPERQMPLNEIEIFLLIIGWLTESIIFFSL